MSNEHSSGDNALSVTMETSENQQLKVNAMFRVYYPLGFLRKVVAEAVATFLLVFVSCGAAAIGTSNEETLVPFYVVAQLIGSISASFALKVLFHRKKHVGITTPSGTDLEALIMEIIVTFILMFITSAMVTDSKAVKEVAGIAVGSSVCISSIIAGPVSGGSMNPARTIGPAIANKVYKSVDGPGLSQETSGIDRLGISRESSGVDESGLAR
ncbi:hypothetical protein L2E82_16787 [Cichorium intybus]|uniref:Uncharacterized protein n=1 Tax=Cichorium intybus TaxID=13427 RepID=A0ACB9F6I0_CICIN|nr:hypothetical protein L2E82_16787 [Cichorium intybus]